MILRKKKKKNYDPSYQLVGKQGLDIDKSKTLFANVACGFLELCHEKVFVTCFKVIIMIIIVVVIINI